MAAAEIKQRLRLLYRNSDNPRTHHTQRTSRANGHVNYAAPDEWAAIIYPASDRMTAVGYSEHASKRARSMSARHFATMTDAAIIGGKTRFGSNGRNSSSHRRNKTNRLIQQTHSR